MILLRRIIPFIGSALLIASYAGVLLRPLEWQIWTIFIAVITSLSILIMTNWKWKTAEFWSFFYPLLVWMIGGTSLLFFVTIGWVQWVLAALIIIVYAGYTENIFTYIYQPQRYTNLSLPNLAFYLMVAGTFTMATAGFGLEFIQVIPYWLIIVLAGLHGGVMMTLHLRGYNALKRQQWPTIGVSALLLAQLAWVLQYWPTAFIINGMLMAIMVYSVPSLFLAIARDSLQRAQIIQYSSITLIALIATLASAQWT